jgi:primase-polymerase (primpol)-like protein
MLETISRKLNPKPTALYPAPDTIPAELLNIPQWVVWRYEQKISAKGDVGWTKPPYVPALGGKLRAAAVNNPKDWADSQRALGCLTLNRPDVAGIGLVLTPELESSSVTFARRVQTCVGAYAPFCSSFGNTL